MLRFNESEMDDDFFDDMEPSDDDLERIELSKEIDLFIAQKIKHSEEPADMVVRQVVGHMKRYFANKSMEFGGPIRDEDLLRAENIQLVKKIDLPGAIDVAYESLGKCDNETVISILAAINQAYVPKTYAGGILLLHIELCMGYIIS